MRGPLDQPPAIKAYLEERQPMAEAIRKHSVRLRPFSNLAGNRPKAEGRLSAIFDR
jgi:hypothetical protein